MAHTLGPWDAVHMAGTTSPWWTIRDKRNIYIAEVDWVDNAVLVEEAEANARLIAAAPELLAVCKALTEILWPWPKDIDAVKESARVAIAKAEGG